MTIPTTIPTNSLRDHAIRLLSGGFADEFAEFVAGDERTHELMMDLAGEFVDRNIPIVNDDDEVDVAAELIMNITVRKV